MIPFDMQLFYAPDMDPAAGFFDLPKEESHHAVKVLRMAEGQEIFATNGRGRMVRGTLATVSPTVCSVRVEEILEDTQKRDYRLHIAVAPTKVNDRMEWFLEKATEIGVDEITPLICARSERRVYNRARGEKVIVSAGKQSLKATFPVLHEAVDFKTFLRSRPAEVTFIAHCMEGEKKQLATSLAGCRDVCVVIGPEGDFSPEEIASAFSAGYVPVSLGDARLRTETAALFAVATAAVVGQLG